MRSHLSTGIAARLKLPDTDFVVVYGRNLGEGGVLNYGTQVSVTVFKIAQ